MPSFDSGYYHLTALIPIRHGDDDPGLWRWHPQARSAAHSLRELLGSFRAVDGCDQPDNDPDARAVPFSRSDRTHFARLLVVDDLAYNGRQQGDTLVDFLRVLLSQMGWKGMAIPERETADHLPLPYLLVLLDFDAPDGRADSVEQYLRELWATMEEEWTLILRHCHGFELDPPRRAQSFIDLLLENEIESTFSFSAYPWAAERARRWLPTGHFRPPRRPAAALRLLKRALVLLLLPGILILLGFLVGCLPTQLVTQALAQHPIATPAWAGPPLRSALVLLLRIGVLLLLAIGLLPPLWQGLMTRANRPWPAQPDADLRSVLKALYLQSSFLEMAEAWQNRDGSSGHSLRHHFRDFLHQTQPDDVDDPTLTPGQIHAIRHSSRP